MAIGRFLSWSNKIIPKKKLISFSSFPDYTDNARTLYEWLISNEDKGIFADHEFIWHVDDMDGLRICGKDKVVKKRTFSSIWNFMRSDYIISTHGLYNAIKTSKAQINILLWHGMPLKKIGYLYDEDIKNGVQEADYYTVTSKFYKDIFQQIFHAHDDQILITGQPRNDELFDDNEKATSLIKQLLGDKIIFYMPTYRNSSIRGTKDGVSLSQANLIFGATTEQWENISEEMRKEGYVLVIKPHPMELRENETVLELNNIKVVDNDWLSKNSLTLYKLLARTDILVTDYSSVYIDFLLLDRPIVFVISDMDSYKESRGFIFDNLTEYLPGPIISSILDLPAALKDCYNYSVQRSTINHLFNDVRDTSFCERVINILTQAISDVSQ